MNIPLASEEALGLLHSLAPELVAVRREIHRNPELSWQESRTTKLVGDRLTRAGIACHPIGKTGLVADLGPRDPAYRVGLRADLDALPLQERTDLPFSSRSGGVSHSCGHDIHTAALLGAAIALQHSSACLEELGLGVRLIFQPAEEVMPGGGFMLHGSSFLKGLDTVFALHCDPTRDVGEVGLREGPITAAGDAIIVTLRGGGGHSSRPHLTADLTYALAKVITDVPAALSRRLDPRAGASLVWGAVHAGSVPNVIPESGQVMGTLRMLDVEIWATVGQLVTRIIEETVAPYGAEVEVDYRQGVPPVVNSAAGVAAMAATARHVLGPDGVGTTAQSLGGEDFAWLLRDVGGALGRLGTRAPGGRTYDLHQGDLLIDESAITAGARLFTVVPFVAQSQAAQASVA